MVQKRYPKVPHILARDITIHTGKAKQDTRSKPFPERCPLLSKLGKITLLFPIPNTRKHDQTATSKARKGSKRFNRGAKC